MRQLIKNSVMITALAWLSHQIILFINGSISVNIGADGFGQCNFYIKAIHFLSHLLLIGQDYALFFFISNYIKQEAYALLKGYVHWVFNSLLKRAVFLILIGLLLFHYGQIQSSLLIGFIIVPIICFDTILNKYLLFQKAYFSSFIPRAIVQAGSFTILFFSLVHFGLPLTTPAIIICYGLSFVICFSVYLALTQSYPLPLKDTVDYSEQNKWVKNGVYFAISTFVITLSRTVIFFFVQSYDQWSPLFSYLFAAPPIIIEPETMGYLGAITSITFGYHLYTKGVELYLKPLITSRIAKQDYKGLQVDIIQANRVRYLIVWLTTLWIVLDPYSRLANFGLDYLQIMPELISCAICYHIYTMGQPALDVMVFGGHQKIVARILQIKLFCIFVLAFVLIPQYGLMGAVIADSLPAAASALAAAIWARFNLPIRVLAVR